MDDIDKLLTPGTVPPLTTDRAWDNTRGVLRRRRWVRRGGRLVMLTVVFAAGALTYRTLDQPTKLPTQHELAKLEPARPKVPPAERFRHSHPEKIERWANMAGPEERVELYRLAGDGFLQLGDQLGAVRCYRKALDGGKPDDLVVQATDTWLMMSLKKARQTKEN